jgi:hypothetical protein
LVLCGELREEERAGEEGQTDGRERVSSSLKPEVLSSVSESFNDGGSAIIDSAILPEAAVTTCREKFVSWWVSE